MNPDPFDWYLAFAAVCFGSLFALFIWAYIDDMNNSV